MPLRAVDDAVHLLAGVRHLLLDAHLVRVEVHQPALEAEAARAEEALVDPRRPQDVRAEVAYEGHRGQPQHTAGDQHGDPRSVRQRGRDEEPVRDDDELAHRAQLEGEVVGGRAGVERDRFSVVHHRGRCAGDCALLLDLQPKPQVEPDLGAVPPGAHAPADARDKTLAGERREIAANRDLRDRKRLRKFRNRHGIARLEQAQHVLHPLLLG